MTGSPRSKTASAQNQYAFAGSKTIADIHQKFSVNMQNDKQALLTVLKTLNKEKGVYFLYSEENVGKQLVNPVKDTKADIEKILDDVLLNSD